MLLLLMLPYTFPRSPAQSNNDAALSRDAQIGKNLEMEPSNNDPRATKSYEPFVKSYGSNTSTPESIHLPINDPIDDILDESQKIIEDHVIDLPYNKMYNDTKSRNIFDAIAATKKAKQESETLHQNLMKRKNKHEDALACHADNIMRMAMDSTMLSSFNHSYSSSFSNINDDSILKRSDDPAKHNAVEISADDLKSAIELPY